MPTFTLRLTGNGTVAALAEQANLRIASCSQGPNKQLVSDEVLTTASYIEDMLRRVQAQKSGTPSPAHWTQSTLSVSDWIEHVPLHLARGQDIVGNIPNETSSSSVFGNNPLSLSSESMNVIPVRRYRGRIEFDVRFTDFAILRDFTTHLTASVDDCEILGPTWALPEASEERYKSQLRMKAAKDARTKAVDYCQVACPGRSEVIIVPKEMGSENFAGGLFSEMNRSAQPKGTLFSVSQVQPTSSNAKKEADPSYTPPEIKMTLSVDFVFTVETDGFKLSSVLNNHAAT